MRRFVIAGALAATISFVGSGARAEFTGNVIRIGILTDMTGVASDLLGPGSVVAAKMAVADFGSKIGDTPIEIVSADHMGKADVGAALARKWFDDEGVDVIGDVPLSGIALAVSEIAKEKNKIYLASGASTSRLTGDLCSPNTVQWAIDGYAAVKTAGSAILKSGGGRTWFLIMRDDAWGKDLEAQIRAILTAAGGTISGIVRHPTNTADFSSYLLQAQSSGAEVVVFGNAANDFVNSVKQAAEYGMMRGKQKIVTMSANLWDFRSIGAQTTQGMYVPESFYWDLDDKTRDFSKRFAEGNRGRMPSQYQADLYSAIIHYLKAVKALGSDGDGRAVVAKMKELPSDDVLHGKGSIRADGRKMHQTFLFQVKSPAESKSDWDLYKLVGTIPVEDAWRPLQESECPLVAKKS